MVQEDSYRVHPLEEKNYGGVDRLNSKSDDRSHHLNKICANLVSGAKLAHAAVPGGDYGVTPAPGTAQGALLHQKPAYFEVLSICEELSLLRR
jgi:hypothetical protein